MFNAFSDSLMWVAALSACASLAACSKSTARLDADVQQSAPAMPRTGCTGTWLSPSAIPPEPGMWTDDGADRTRVVAMIGPTDLRAGSTAVTRTIETIEGVGAPQPIRTRADAAVMHLDFPPRSSGDPRGAASGGVSADRPTEPAAAYTLAPFISVIAYEACVGPAGVRYLRRDPHGGIARDAMLRRVSGPK